MTLTTFTTQCFPHHIGRKIQYTGDFLIWSTKIISWRLIAVMAAGSGGAKDIEVLWCWQPLGWQAIKDNCIWGWGLPCLLTWPPHDLISVRQPCRKELACCSDESIQGRLSFISRLSKSLSSWLFTAFELIVALSFHTRPSQTTWASYQNVTTAIVTDGWLWRRLWYGASQNIQVTLSCPGTMHLMYTVFQC